jgi:hypothetical protein
LLCPTLLADPVPRRCSLAVPGRVKALYLDVALPPADQMLGLELVHAADTLPGIPILGVLQIPHATKMTSAPTSFGTAAEAPASAMTM